MGPLLAACFVRWNVLARTLERIYIHSNMYTHTTNIMSSSHWGISLADTGRDHVRRTRFAGLSDFLKTETERMGDEISLLGLCSGGSALREGFTSLHAGRQVT